MSESSASPSYISSMHLSRIGSSVTLRDVRSLFAERSGGLAGGGGGGDGGFATGRENHCADASMLRVPVLASSMSCFHFLTSSLAASATVWMGYERSLPTANPALVC